MFLKPPHDESISTDFAEHRYEPFVRTMPSLASNTVMSPGRRAAQSTKPPPSGAREVVMKNDSPLSTLSVSDFMKPPSAFDSISTPPDMAIIAPDSARHSSPAPSCTRQTEKAGLWQTVISIGTASRFVARLRAGSASLPVLQAERSTFAEAGAQASAEGRTFAWRFAVAARFSLSAFARWFLRS